MFKHQFQREDKTMSLTALPPRATIEEMQATMNTMPLRAAKNQKQTTRISRTGGPSSPDTCTPDSDNRYDFDPLVLNIQ